MLVTPAQPVSRHLRAPPRCFGQWRLFEGQGPGRPPATLRCGGSRGRRQQRTRRRQASGQTYASCGYKQAAGNSPDPFQTVLNVSYGRDVYVYRFPKWLELGAIDGQRIWSLSVPRVSSLQPDGAVPRPAGEWTQGPGGGLRSPALRKRADGGAQPARLTQQVWSSKPQGGPAPRGRYPVAPCSPDNFTSSPSSCVVLTALTSPGPRTARL